MAIATERAVVGMISTNAYIIRSSQEDKRAVLIDPGGSAPELIGNLRSREIKPEAILLTHGHYDHIMAVNEIRDAWPDLRVYILEAEKPMTEDPSLNCGFFGETCTIRPDEYLYDGEEVTLAGVTFRVIASPGHTAGSCCYYVAEEGILFSGDTIFRAGYGRTDLPTGDTRKLMESISHLLGTLPEETVIYPGHGEATTVKYERMVEGYLL